MQTTAIRTVAKSLPENEVILLTHLISTRYIPYTDLRKKNCLLCYKSMMRSLTLVHVEIESRGGEAGKRSLFLALAH